MLAIHSYLSKAPWLTQGDGFIQKVNRGGLMAQKLLHNIITGAALALPILSLNAPSALADRRDFTIINENELAITHLYVSSGRSNYWGVDILGQDILRSGQSKEINFHNNSDQCVYDVKVVYEDHSYDVGRFNLCQTTSVRLTGNGGNSQPRQ